MRLLRFPSNAITTSIYGSYQRLHHRFIKIIKKTCYWTSSLQEAIDLWLLITNACIWKWIEECINHHNRLNMLWLHERKNGYHVPVNCVHVPIIYIYALQTKCKTIKGKKTCITKHTLISEGTKEKRNDRKYIVNIFLITFYNSSLHLYMKISTWYPCGEVFFFIS